MTQANRKRIHLNVLIVSASGGLKPQCLVNVDIWRLLYRRTFTDEGGIRDALE